MLHQAFGKVEGVVRATRQPDVPLVLFREEMATLLQHVPPPSELVVKRLYGCGLRLAACLQRHVPCFDVAAGVFTLHDGKGGKDRTVPLPELRAPRASLKALHQRDLEGDDAGVLLVNA
jgi:integrase